ncbi:chalcone isomerase family protein [Roseateles sp.]|uniref:chalcone isomerase family protein n=1 Tax=Roseateles sp. TaxID=1971397 RepID=UPI003BA7AD97
MRTRRQALQAACALALISQGTAHAAPELSELRQQSKAQMRFFGLLIYDIRLWSREPIDAQNWSAQELALELQYARSLSGREIAKRSLSEMRRQVDISNEQGQKWLSEMEAAFPDVREGDRISGLQTPGEGVRFFVNGRLQRRIADPMFARLFFGIWLAPQSSEPGLRQQLLGGRREGT